VYALQARTVDRLANTLVLVTFTLGADAALGHCWCLQEQQQVKGLLNNSV
jgi:hypothetical protein